MKLKSITDQKECPKICSGLTIGSTKARTTFEMFYEQLTWHEAEKKCRDKGNETSLAAFFSIDELLTLNSARN